jgi:hypothetical protein
MDPDAGVVMKGKMGMKDHEIPAAQVSYVTPTRICKD